MLVCKAFRDLEREPWSSPCARELRRRRLEREKVNQGIAMLAGLFIATVATVLIHRERIGKTMPGPLRRLLGLEPSPACQDLASSATVRRGDGEGVGQK